jgi:uncharacterized protein (DUF362 family)
MTRNSAKGKHLVSIVRYEEPLESVKQAVNLSSGLKHLPARAKVFIKPNIVFWSRSTPFPKWGVITTSRVVEDMVELLIDAGASSITIGEGTVLMDPKDRETIPHAYHSLGYGFLSKRYGVNCLNLFERPFRKLDLGDDISLRFNTDILESDFVINLPVLKTHAQTVVSLGIKNLKGTIDLPSRKYCHTDDPEKNLHFRVAKLADPMPPMFTLLDGIYTLERGPSFDGRVKRSNLLIASSDVLSADLIGAKVLGYSPEEVPHLVHAANNRNRPLDLTDIQLAGESISDVATPHKYSFPYNKEDTLPLPMARMKIQGLSYPKYDLSLCTYCSYINGALLTAVARAWDGTPWDDVEILTGKTMKPTPGRKKTILLGKCIYQANKDNPEIQELIPIKGCPPRQKDIVKALHQAGIRIDSSIIEQMDLLPGSFMKRYENKPDFDESFFSIESAAGSSSSVST